MPSAWLRVSSVSGMASGELEQHAGYTRAPARVGLASPRVSPSAQVQHDECPRA